MKVDRLNLQDRLIRKACKSICTYKVSAAAIDSNGTCIDIAHNIPRAQNVFRNYHAEEIILHRNPHKIISEILILRVGRSGELLPIEPCSRCLRLAKKFNVTIKTLQT